MEIPVLALDVQVLALVFPKSAVLIACWWGLFITYISLLPAGITGLRNGLMLVKEIRPQKGQKF